MALNSLYTIKLIDSPIEAAELSSEIAQFQNNPNIGAYNIFLGQVREDLIDGKTVAHIEFSSFEEMAKDLLSNICIGASQKFDIAHVSIIHSLGMVKKGDLCLLVMVCAGHREASFEACSFIVEQIKKEVPIWGKETFTDNSHIWKINKF